MLPNPLSHSLTHSFTHPLTHSLTHSLDHSLTHSIKHSLTHSIKHSLTLSLIHWLTPTHNPSTCPIIPSMWNSKCAANAVPFLNTAKQIHSHLRSLSRDLISPSMRHAVPRSVHGSRCLGDRWEHWGVSRQVPDWCSVSGRRLQCRKRKLSHCDVTTQLVS